MQEYLLEISRIGVGCMFFIAALTDIVTRAHIFNLMLERRLPAKWFLFTFVVFCKFITTLGLIFNIYTLYSAIILATLIFLASCVFQNFWSASRKDFSEKFIAFFTNVAVSFGLLGIASAYVT